MPHVIDKQWEYTPIYWRTGIDFDMTDTLLWTNLILTLSGPTPQNGQTHSSNYNCLSVFDHSAGIVHIGVSTPLKKTCPLPLSCQAPPPLPLKSANCPSPPFSNQSPLYIGFSWTSRPPKPRIFQWTPKILEFFIFHPILSFKSN